MITPLPSRLLLRPLPRPRHSATIETPELDELAAEETPQPAEVIARATLNRDAKGREKPWTVNVGDRVLIIPFMGAEVFDDDGTRHLIMREDAVIGLLEP